MAVGAYRWRAGQQEMKTGDFGGSTHVSKRRPTRLQAVRLKGDLADGHWGCPLLLRRQSLPLREVRPACRWMCGARQGAAGCRGRQAEQTIPLLLARWLCNCDWDVMPTPLPLPLPMAMPTYSTARQPRATERAEAFGGRGQGSPATHWTHALCCPTLVDAQWVSIVRLRRRHCIGHAQGRTVSSHHQFHPF